MLLVEKLINTNITLLEADSENKAYPDEIRFRGIFSSYDKKNGNNRIYKKSLWEKVLKDKKVLESLKNGRMLGELEHPEYRNVRMQNASHMVYKLELGDDGFVYGEAKTLDTPDGRILGACIKAGCKPGVSTRGEGSVIEENDCSYVDESDYELLTVDVTLDPSVSEAFPNIMESTIAKAVSSLLESSSLTKTDLDALELFVKTHNLDRNLFLEKINNKRGNTQNKNSGEPMNELQETLSKLHEATTKISNVKALHQATKTELQLLKNNTATLKENNKKLQKQISSLKSLLESEREKTKDLNRKLSLAESVSTKLVSRFKIADSNYNKSINVISALSKKANSVASSYSKAIKVVENVQQKVSSAKVDEYLKANLASLGGVNKFKGLIGDVTTLSEAQRKVSEIKKLVSKDRDFISESTSPLRKRVNLDESQNRQTPRSKVMGNILDLI